MANKKKVIKELRSWTLSLIGAVFVALIFSSEVFANVQVQQRSMENTLFNDQRLIIDKVSYNFVQPKRGDIVIILENNHRGNILHNTEMVINDVKSTFNDEETNKRIVKRVIGVPGDEVDIKDGYVYINGKKLNETYVKGVTYSNNFQFPIKVTENKLFVLGDNREVSRDSRSFGLVDYNQVDGKAIFRVFPFNKIGSIK